MQHILVVVVFAGFLVACGSVPPTPISMALANTSTAMPTSTPQPMSTSAPTTTPKPSTATPEPAVAAEHPTPGSTTPGTTAASPVVNLLNPRIPRALAGQPGWAYQRVATADLDGDGVMERVVLIADAIVEQGRPLWDDGQRWQVYIEEPDGTRTYVYAQLLQLGTLTVRLARATTSQALTLLLMEQLPQQLGVYEVSYRGPGQARVVELVKREFDTTSWEGTSER